MASLPHWCTLTGTSAVLSFIILFSMGILDYLPHTQGNMLNLILSYTEGFIYSFIVNPSGNLSQLLIYFISS